MSEHTGSAKLYYVIWGTLLFLTFVTTAVAKFDLGAFNTLVALSIATIKALLVVLFFMHVKSASERMIKIVVASAIFWLLLMLILTLSDYATGRTLSTA